VLILLWFCVAGSSVMAGLLAVRGDIVMERDALRQTRLWLVHEEGDRGVGLSTTRYANGNASSDTACVETRVRFLLWQSKRGAQNTRYCECYHRDGNTWQLSGACAD
jgi:hypothetical protein